MPITSGEITRKLRLSLARAFSNSLDGRLRAGVWGCGVGGITEGESNFSVATNIITWLEPESLIFKTQVTPSIRDNGLLPVDVFLPLRKTKKFHDVWVCEWRPN